MSLQIRPAEAGDAATIVRLIRDLADYERLLHEVRITEADLTAALFCETPRVFCDIARWNGEPVGLALWFYTFSTFVGRHGIWLEDLFVEPDKRGLGIGKALLTGLAERCVAEGLGRLEWSVLDWNAPSIAFYESLGARPMSDWTTYRLADDALASVGRKGV
ncbi:GNAT family N-acetyltransferase [Amorphus orientalis]|uniref:GNAT superfamily N-acetyltransferase n=1 Tax=Amorphus orientalis TaxID=649198 RepID=A0AAE3VNH7_9HYPH|nr:GNAT family N-acetyltransferase [Amorphus orientalis]MDQ0315286.1 GNAT superfamily N-acetyltransferase [Amorphus orientalis]